MDQPIHLSAVWFADQISPRWPHLTIDPLIESELFDQLTWSDHRSICLLLIFSVFKYEKIPKNSWKISKKSKKIHKILENKKEFLMKEKFWKSIFLIPDDPDTPPTPRQRFSINLELVHMDNFIVLFIYSII